MEDTNGICFHPTLMKKVVMQQPYKVEKITLVEFSFLYVVGVNQALISCEAKEKIDFIIPSSYWGLNGPYKLHYKGQCPRIC